MRQTLHLLGAGMEWIAPSLCSVQQAVLNRRYRSHATVEALGPNSELRTLEGEQHGSANHS
jgi:hypothetical protein